MLRPSEMDTNAVSIALIHRISTNAGQASSPSPLHEKGKKSPALVSTRASGRSKFLYNFHLDTKSSYNGMERFQIVQNIALQH